MNKFEMLSEKEYNPAKNVYAAFYSYDENGKLQILLKKEVNENEYSLISGEKTSTDNTPIIGISRILATEYRGLFSKENFAINSFNEITLNKENMTWFEIILNPMFQEWVHLLSDNPVQFDSIKDHLIYFYEIDYLNLEKLNKQLDSINYKYRFSYLDISNDASPKEEDSISVQVAPLTEKLLKTIGNIQNFIDESKVTEDSPKFVIISCILPETQGYDDWGYWLYPSIFIGLYRKNKEKWIYCRSDLNQLPDDSILMNNCKALVFPGSLLHVYDNHEYVINTVKWIKEFISNENYKKIKLLGICFGHQMTANSYGIEVRQRPQGDCIERVEQLEINDSFWELDFVKNSGIKQGKKSINIFQAHLDEINPTEDHLKNIDMKVLSSSKTCENEMCLYEKGRIFTFQGHPEYNPEFFLFRKSKVLYSEAENNKENFDQLVKNDMDEYYDLYKSDYEMLYVTYSFLKHCL